MASNTLLKIVFVGLFVSFLFILLTGVMAVKINNGDTCGFDKLISSNDLSDVDYYTFINSSSNVLVSTPNINNNNYVYYDFCVRGNASSDLILSVIDEDDVFLGNIYFGSGVNTFCTVINNLSDYVGVSCTTCDDVDNFTIYQSIATNIPTNYLINIPTSCDSDRLLNESEYYVYGNYFGGYHWDGYNLTAPSQLDREAFLFHTFKTYIYDDCDITNNDYSFVVESNPLSYNLYGANSCKETVKLFNKYYISVIGVLLLLFLIILGASTMEENLVGVFGKKEDDDDE